MENVQDFRIIPHSMLFEKNRSTKKDDEAVGKGRDRDKGDNDEDTEYGGEVVDEILNRLITSAVR